MQVAAAFARSQWCGKPIHVLTPAVDASIRAMQAKIEELAPGLDFTKDPKPKDLVAHPDLQQYMDKHCLRSKYMFQWQAKPTQLPPLPLRTALGVTAQSTCSTDDGTCLTPRFHVGSTRSLRRSGG